MNNTISILGFNGEYLDDTLDSYHLGNGYRAYNPTIMQFTAPDDMSPFGAGGINPYMYVSGDPINNTDPTGHFNFIGVGFNLGMIGFGIGSAVATVMAKGVSVGSVIAVAGAIYSTYAGIKGVIADAQQDHQGLSTDEAINLGVTVAAELVGYWGYKFLMNKIASLASSGSDIELEARSATSATNVTNTISRSEPDEERIYHMNRALPIDPIWNTMTTEEQMQRVMLKNGRPYHEYSQPYMFNLMAKHIINSASETEGTWVDKMRQLASQHLPHFDTESFNMNMEYTKHATAMGLIRQGGNLAIQNVPTSSLRAIASRVIFKQIMSQAGDYYYQEDGPLVTIIRGSIN